MVMSFIKDYEIVRIGDHDFRAYPMKDIEWYKYLELSPSPPQMTEEEENEFHETDIVPASAFRRADANARQIKNLQATKYVLKVTLMKHDPKFRIDLLDQMEIIQSLMPLAIRVIEMSAESEELKKKSVGIKDAK